MLLIVGYSHKDENGSTSIIIVNIATTGEGKGNRNTRILYVNYDEHVRARIINRAPSIYFPMRSSQCYQFVPAMLSVLTALALTNVILDIVFNEGLSI